MRGRSHVHCFRNRSGTEVSHKYPDYEGLSESLISPTARMMSETATSPQVAGQLDPLIQDSSRKRWWRQPRTGVALGSTQTAEPSSISLHEAVPECNSFYNGNDYHRRPKAPFPMPRRHHSPIFLERRMHSGALEGLCAIGSLVFCP